MKKVGKRNLDSSVSSEMIENEQTNFNNNNAFCVSTALKPLKDIKDNTISCVHPNRPTIVKASSFKHQPLKNGSQQSELNKIKSSNSIVEKTESSSELQHKLKSRCQKIDEAFHLQTNDQTSYNSLPPLSPKDGASTEDKETESGENLLNSPAEKYMDSDKKYSTSIPPRLPNKSKNVIPLPPKSNANDSLEEHYAVPKTLSTQTQRGNIKYKRRSLTKPQVPNKPVTLRKPPIVAKPPSLKPEANERIVAKNRTACKAVLHTSATNKTHLKLFQPANDAHSRIRGTS